MGGGGIWDKAVYIGGGGDMGGHVLRETTSRGLCGLRSPTPTSKEKAKEQFKHTHGFTAGPSTKLLAWGGVIWEDMCYQRRRAEACVDEAAPHELVNRGCVWVCVCYCRTVCVCVCLLLQDLVQSCLHGGRGIWEDMCYERRRAEACVGLVQNFLQCVFITTVPNVKTK
jgi:hypothetical protein